MKTPYAQLSENFILLVITPNAGGTAVLRKSPVCRGLLHGGCHDTSWYKYLEDVDR
jgi:hypothetical protein